jgi:hypothetical protein
VQYNNRVKGYQPEVADPFDIFGFGWGHNCGKDFFKNKLFLPAFKKDFTSAGLTMVYAVPGNKLPVP